MPYSVEFEVSLLKERVSLMAHQVKNLSAMQENTRDVGSVPGLGISQEEENGNQLYYSCLKNPMDRGGRAGYSLY